MERSIAFGRMWELLERDHGGCEEENCTLSRLIGEGSDEALEVWHTSGAADAEFETLFKKYWRK